MPWTNNIFSLYWHKWSPGASEIEKRTSLHTAATEVMKNAFRFIIGKGSLAYKNSGKMLILFQYYFRDVCFSKYALQVLWLWCCKSTLISTSTVNFTWNVIIKHFHESWTLDQCNSCAFNPKFMYYQQRKLIFMAINTVHGCYIRWLFCILLIWMQHLTIITKN